MSTPQERYIVELRKLADAQSTQKHPVQQQWARVHGALADVLHQELAERQRSTATSPVLPPPARPVTDLEDVSPGLLDGLTALADECGLLGVSQVVGALLRLGTADPNGLTALFDAHRSTGNAAVDASAAVCNADAVPTWERSPTAQAFVHDVTDDVVLLRVVVDASDSHDFVVETDGRFWRFDESHPSWPHVQGELRIDRPDVSRTEPVTVTFRREGADSTIWSATYWLPQLETGEQQTL